MASSESQRNVAGGSSPCHELFTDGICRPFAVHAVTGCNYLKIMILFFIDVVLEKGGLENTQGIGNRLKGRIRMDLSGEKRKMPRMKVDLSACIFWGLAKKQSEVTVRNLSIHGISFRAKKFLPRGTQFNLIIPNHRKDSETHNIQAEVVRCESLNGFSSDGKFKGGGKIFV